MTAFPGFPFANIKEALEGASDSTIGFPALYLGDPKSAEISRLRGLLERARAFVDALAECGEGDGTRIFHPDINASVTFGDARALTKEIEEALK